MLLAEVLQRSSLNPAAAPSSKRDLPVTDTLKRVLEYAQEECERLGCHEIGTGHLLLGLVRDENAILSQRGLFLEPLRNEIRRSSSAEAPALNSGAPPALQELSVLIAAIPESRRSGVAQVLRKLPARYAKVSLLTNEGNFVFTFSD